MAPTPRPDTVPLLIFLTPPGILCSSTPAPWLPVSPLAASFFVTIAFLLRTVARFRRRTRQQAAADRAAAAGRLPRACTRGRLQGSVPLEFDALELETAPDRLFEACIELLRLVAARFGSLLPSHPLQEGVQSRPSQSDSLTTLLDVKPKKKSTSFAADVRG